MRLLILATLLALTAHARADLNHCITHEGKTLVTDGECPTGSVVKRVTTPTASQQGKDTTLQTTKPPSSTTKATTTDMQPAKPKPMQY